MAVFLRGRKWVSLETHFIFPYILLLCLATIYEFVFTLLLQVNVNFWFSFYLLLEFGAIAYFFCRLLHFMKLWYGLSLFYLIFFALLHFQRNENNELILDGYLSTVTFVTTVSLATFWFVSSLKGLTHGRFVSTHVFLYAGSILVYLASTLFLFLFGGLIYNENHNDFTDFWLLNVLFSFISRIIISIAIWRDHKI